MKFVLICWKGGTFQGQGLERDKMADMNNRDEEIKKGIEQIGQIQLEEEYSRRLDELDLTPEEYIRYTPQIRKLQEERDRLRQIKTMAQNELKKAIGNKKTIQEMTSEEMKQAAEAIKKGALDFKDGEKSFIKENAIVLSLLCQEYPELREPVQEAMNRKDNSKKNEVSQPVINKQEEPKSDEPEKPKTVEDKIEERFQYLNDIMQENSSQQSAQRMTPEAFDGAIKDYRNSNKSDKSFIEKLKSMSGKLWDYMATIPGIGHFIGLFANDKGDTKGGTRGSAKSSKPPLRKRIADRIMKMMGSKDEFKKETKMENKLKNEFLDAVYDKKAVIERDFSKTEEGKAGNSRYINGMRIYNTKELKPGLNKYVVEINSPDEVSPDGKIKHDSKYIKFYGDISKAKDKDIEHLLRNYDFIQEQVEKHGGYLGTFEYDENGKRNLVRNDEDKKLVSKEDKQLFHRAETTKRENQYNKNNQYLNRKPEKGYQLNETYEPRETAGKAANGVAQMNKQSGKDAGPSKA